jgi:hypothetical protein
MKSSWNSADWSTILIKMENLKNHYNSGERKTIKNHQMPPKYTKDKKFE